LINWRAVLHAFFEQLFQEKILSANPIGAIRKPKHIREAPPIFTPEELTKLLGAASGHLVAPLAIQAFPGLRTSETSRLHWQNVQDSYIHVNAEIAKTSRRRLVKILPNLASWLEVPAKSRGIVWPNGARTITKRPRSWPAASTSNGNTTACAILMRPITWPNLPTLTP
jgi:integrase